MIPHIYISLYPDVYLIISITIYPYMYLVTMHICCPNGYAVDLFTLFIFLFAFALRPGVCFRTGAPVGSWVLLVADEFYF